jgi:hypothetical protein
MTAVESDTRPDTKTNPAGPTKAQAMRVVISIFGILAGLAAIELKAARPAASTSVTSAIW